MNCTQCGEHILATTSVAWNKGDFHPDCVGQAVSNYRAKQERMNNPLTQNDIEALEDEQIFDDEYDEMNEFADHETDDDLDDLVERLDNMPEVSDEILNQIPAQMPEYRPEVHINDVVATATNQFVAGRQGNGVAVRSVGTLISGNTTTLINRSALKHLPMPEATPTHQPISHYSLVEQIHECLSYRQLTVVREEYAVSPDGMKCFGLLELNVDYAGVRFAIGLRNSNDKSMRIGLVAGYRVMVCENKMLTGDFNPLSAKHSKNFNLIDACSVAVDRIQRNIGGVSDQIDRKKVTTLSQNDAESLVYQAFLNQRLPISLLRSVHNEYFVKPSFEDFSGRNLWSLENAFTTVFKKLKPVQQFEACAKLGKFLTPHISPF
jgi:hypothetical protein